MSSNEVYAILKDLDICCIGSLRYLNVRCNEFDNVDQAYKNRNIEVPKDDQDDEPDVKRLKPNITCLGLFQSDNLDIIAKEIVENTNLNEFECETIYTSISIPILLQIRELALWIHLFQTLPGKINETTAPNISIKETFKYIMNTKLCKITGKTLEPNQNGILVNVFFDHEAEHIEIQRFDAITPSSIKNNMSKKKQGPMTRTLFEKNFYPDNLDLDKCKIHLPVPPTPLSTPIKLVKCTISGPTVFAAGRYRKLSRDLSQTPWILEGKRMKCDSLQEIIARSVAPYFGIDFDTNSEKIVFMASGREDIDVRCLGKGRPFVMEIQDAKKIVLAPTDAAKIESQVDLSKLVSIQHLQIVKRDDLVHIKMGEEEKRKIYRAQCVLQQPVTAETMQMLDIPNGFLVQQKTPLRVLHRRPLLTRPRQIFSVRGYVEKDNPNCVILDVVTQAGTYVKELVHGEFGRTSPSIASIIGQEIDIVALDVNAIELDWPVEINNQTLSN